MSGRPAEGGFVTRLIAVLIARPWVTLAIIIAATVGAGIWGSTIQIRGDMEDLFPDSTPNVVRARQARALLGSTSELQVLIGSPNAELNRTVGGRIAAFLDARDDVDRVEFERDISFFESNALLFLPQKDLDELAEQVSEKIQEAVKQDLGLDDFEDDDDDEGGGEAKEASSFPTIDDVKERYGANGLSKYHESPDGQVIAVKAYPSFKPASASKTKVLNAAIDAELAAILAETPKDAELTFTTEGDYSQLTEAVDQIGKDATRASLVALALIALVLVVYFRRLRAIVLVLVPLVVGLVWTLAFAKLGVGYFNLITIMLFGILLGLGIDFAVHAAGRIDNTFRPWTPLREAVPTALSSLGRAMIAAGVTTSATFLALMAFDFRGFSQLGLIAGVGVLLALLSVYLVLPPLAVALDKLVPAKPRNPDNEETPAAQASSKAGPMVYGPGAKRWGTLILMCGLLGAVGGGLLVQDLVFEADMRKLRPKQRQASSALKTKYKAEAENRTASPALLITEDLTETERVHRHLAGLVETMPVLQEYASVYSFVPEDQAAKLAVVAEMKRKVDNKYGLLEGKDKEDADRLRAYLSPKAFGPTDLPPWVKEKFTDTEGRFGRYVLLYAKGSKANADNVLKIGEQIGSITLPATADAPERTLNATASYFILGDAFTTVQREGPLAVALACLVVLLLLSVDLRRPRDVMTALLPLLTGFAIFLGVLVMADVQLNLYNVVVLPTIFGIGVDTAIHLVHRLHEGASLRETLRTTGSAAAVSSLTTAIGFGSLIAVDNEGLQSIGWVAVIGIAVTYVVTLSMTTALVLTGFFKRRTA